jgi:hypothetical protein
MTEIIYYILSNNSGVTDLVSTRIYPMRLPLNTDYPAITFQLVDAIPINQKSGRANYINARVQVNCYAVDKDSISGNQSSINIARAVKSALERVGASVKALVLSNTGLTLINSTLLSEVDLTDDNSDYEGVFFRALDFNICYDE